MIAAVAGEDAALFGDVGVVAVELGDIDAA
jgi:hypothetical protein